MENNSRNVIIKDLEFFWAKLDPKKPVAPFGEDRWELQVRFPSKRDEEMSAYGKVKPVNDEKNKSFINLVKKAELASGEPAKPVRVVDASKEPLDPKIIGNGSAGNVMLMLRDYEIKHPKTGKVTKSGTTSMLIAVQVTKLVKYEPKSGLDFDNEGDDNSPDNADDAPF